MSITDGETTSPHGCTMVQPEPYVYTALGSTQSVRLVTIYPGREGEPLQCSLKETHLDKPLSYIALSYTWGDEADLTPILCHGKELRITRNLEAALLRQRHVDQSSTLWVDSICINQADLAERSQQVKLMGQVYLKAAFVLIWLGEQDEETEMAYECAQLVHQKIFQPGKRLTGNKKFLYELRKLKDPCEFFGLPRPMSDEFKAIKNLLHRPWFDRAWVYQESTLARKSYVKCGTFSISGRHLFEVCITIEALQRGRNGPEWWFVDNAHVKGEILLFKGPLAELDQARPNVPNVNWNTILHLLHIRRIAKAKDPRDKIYSLLGVANDAQGIVPDYTKSVEGVYISLAKHVIRTNRNLKVLGNVDPQETTRPPRSLPSWVPDWRVGLNTNFSFTTEAVDLYYGTGSSKTSVQDISDPTKLSVRGMRIATVETLAEPANIIQWGVTLMWLEHHVKPVPGRMKWYEPTDEGLSMAFIRTCCADRNIWPIWPDEMNVKRSGRFGHRERWSTESFETHKQRNDLRELQLHVTSTTAYRRFFLTPDLHMGLAPYNAEKGDLVYLLFGCEVPVILRSDGEEFRFIGECYIHGFMDGEALVQARRNAQPDYDHSDTSWLDRLHEEPLPFETRWVVIR